MKSRGVKRSIVPPCKFGKVLLSLLEKHKMTPYDVEKKAGISAAAVERFIRCMRFPAIVKTGKLKRISIEDLANAIGLNEEEKYQLYSALIETFYPGIYKFFPEVDESKLNKDYIGDLLHRKLKGYTWTEIYEQIPEATVRKLKNLRLDIMLLSPRDALKEYLNYLDLNNKEKAEILWWYMTQKEANPEVLKILKKEDNKKKPER